MVELFEGILVFAVMAGVVVAGIAIIQNQIPGLNQVVDSSEMSQVVGSARLAIVNGNTSSIILLLNNATISCENGIMTTSLSNSTSSTQMGFPCSFSLEGLTGECDLTFSSRTQFLTVEADC